MAVHTDKFDRVARSVAAVNGMSELRQVFVPQPVMGKSPSELRAYVDGRDPLTGRPVMQEVIEGLTQPFDGQGVGTIEYDRSTPRLVEADTEENLHQLFLESRWTDYLPIVLPTEERVAAMLAATRSEAGRGRRAHAPDALPRIVGVHGREGRGQRGDGRGAAGVFPGDPGAGGDRRERARQHDQLDGRHGRRQRADPQRDQDERRDRRAGAVQPRQRDDRPRLRSALAESPGRLAAGAHLHGLAGQQLRLQQHHVRGERGAEPVGAVPRPARLSPDRQHRQRLQRMPGHRLHARDSREALARARPQHAARHGPAHPAGVRARPDHRAPVHRPRRVRPRRTR